jgi:hypothetical protein
VSYPEVYIFEAQDEFRSKILAIVAMSEENALEQVQRKYSDHFIYFIKSIKIDTITDQVINLFES